MSSSRLLGKILADIAGQPMLQRVFIRTSRAATVNETIFATTTDSTDDPVEEYCSFSGIPFTRGSLYDVLDRYYQAAKESKADIVVRITADCPVIDPVLIDNCVNTLLDGEYDFVCNRLPPPWHRTYPIGLDVEACTFKVLSKAWKEAKEPQHREHAMPYFYEGVELTYQSRTWKRVSLLAASTSHSCITLLISVIIAGQWIRPKIWNSCGRFIVASMAAMIFHGRKFWIWFTTNPS